SSWSPPGCSSCGADREPKARGVSDMRGATADGTTLGDMVLGAVAGCVDTVPMTWAMEAMHRRLPQQERYPLPPRQITMRVAEKAGVKEDLDEEERLGLTLLPTSAWGRRPAPCTGCWPGSSRSRGPLPVRASV